MENRQAVLDLLDRGLAKFGEVKPQGTTSATRLREGKEKIRAARAKVAEEPEAAPTPTPAPQPPMYIGAWIREGQGSTVPWNGSYWTTFEQLSGCEMALIHFGMAWGKWFASTLGLCAARGAVPFLSIQPPGSLKEILEGKQDVALAQMKAEALAYGKPMLVRFAHEQNGDWYGWGRDPNYIAAWRYVHGKMETANMGWVWCPNAIYDTASRAAFSTDVSKGGMYPGDSYVDWVAFDNYNRGTNPLMLDRWRTPVEVIDTTYLALRELAPSKPILVGEMASTEIGGSKAEWIAELFQALKERYPAIRAFCWFNWAIAEGGGYKDWPVTSSAAALAAWKTKLGDPYFRAVPNATDSGKKLLIP